MHIDQMAEALRAASLSNLDSMANSNSIFNTTPACTYNHPHNLHQKFVPPFQVAFTPHGLLNTRPYFLHSRAQF